MKIEKVLTLLIVVVLIAAAVVAVVKLTGSRPAQVESPPVSEAPGDGSARLLVIGIQGLERTMVDRLSETGRLPNIAGLVSRGASGIYPTFGRNKDIAITWTSLVTGMLPENQGIGGTMISRRGDVIDSPLTPKHRTVGTIWTYLGERGERSGVVGWPATWPVEEIEGIMIGPLSTYTLERKHGGNPADGMSPVSEHERLDHLILDPEQFERRDLSRFVDVNTRLGLESLMGQNRVALAKAYAGDRSAVDVAKAMVGEASVDNLFVNLPGVDLASQRFWHYMDTEAIEKVEVGEDERRLLEGEIEALGGTVDLYYEFVDGLVGELLELAGDGATVALLSDHGYSGIMFDAMNMPKVGANMHSEEAMWVLAGPRVRAGALLDGALIDVAPTIMAAAGIEPSMELNGRVHEDALQR